MNHVNKYLRNFVPYSVASHKIWQVPPNERERVLKLDWNEATIPPSPAVTKRIKELMKHNFLNYYPATYNEEILNGLSGYLDIPQENLQYFASSDSLHEYISKLFITVGDPVFLLWPSYDNFRLTAEVAGARIIYFHYNADFTLNKETLEKSIDEHEPSLVYMCNPNNPLGTVLENEYIEQLIEKYPETMFLIDEAYNEFSGESVKRLTISHDNILISRTMSKAFGLANVRFGYLIASKKNINYISNIRNPKNITTFAQEAILGALSDVDYMYRYVDEVKKVRDDFVYRLNTVYGHVFTAYKSEGNFVLVRCRSLACKAEVLSYFEQNNIYVRDVRHTENITDCFRITIGTGKQMMIVFHVIEAFMKDKGYDNGGL